MYQASVLTGGSARVRCAALLSLVLATLLAAGCAHAPASPAAAVAPAAMASSAPALTLQEPLPGLFTAGQPDALDWAAIHARGVRTVVNLRAPGELKGRDEQAEVEAAGMRYLQIPVTGAEGINADNAAALHHALAPQHGGGVLVHCASGNRAGALLALEQKDFDGASAQSALALGRKAGVTHIEPVLKKALGIGE